MAVQRTKKKRKLSVHQKLKIIDDYFEAKVIDFKALAEKKKDELFRGFQKQLADAEHRATYYELKYNTLEKSVVGLLTAEQLEAADIAGCEPEIYAVEWFKLCMERHAAEKYNVPSNIKALEDGRKW